MKGMKRAIYQQNHENDLEKYFQSTTLAEVERSQHTNHNTIPNIINADESSTKINSISP